MTNAEHAMRVVRALASLPCCTRIEVNSAFTNDVPAGAPGHSRKAKTRFFQPDHVPDSLDVPESVVLLHVIATVGPLDDATAQAVTAAAETLESRADLQPIQRCRVAQVDAGIQVAMILIDGPVEAMIRPPV